MKTTRLTRLQSALGIAVALGAAAAAAPAQAGYYSACSGGTECVTGVVPANASGRYVRFSAWSSWYGAVSYKRVWDFGNCVTVYSAGSGDVWSRTIYGLYGRYQGLVRGRGGVGASLRNFW